MISTRTSRRRVSQILAQRARAASQQEQDFCIDMGEELRRQSALIRTLQSDVSSLMGQLYRMRQETLGRQIVRFFQKSWRCGVRLLSWLFWRVLMRTFALTMDELTSLEGVSWKKCANFIYHELYVAGIPISEERSSVYGFHGSWHSKSFRGTRYYRKATFWGVSCRQGFPKEFVTLATRLKGVTFNNEFAGAITSMASLIRFARLVRKHIPRDSK